MAICISRALHDQLLHWAEKAAPEECCGLLFGHGEQISRLELTENVAAERRSFFEIDPAALIRAHKTGRIGDEKIIGYFHSHPNGAAQPSEYDREIMAAEEKIWLIVTHDLVTCWQITSGQVHRLSLEISDDCQGRYHGA